MAENRRPMLKLNRSYASAVKNVSVNASTQTETPIMASSGSLVSPDISQPPTQSGTKRRAPVEEKVVQNKKILGKVTTHKPQVTPKPANKHPVALQSASLASTDASFVSKDMKSASKDAKIKPGEKPRLSLDASTSRKPSVLPGEKGKSSIGSGVAPASSKGGAATNSGRTSNKFDPLSGRARKGDRSFNLFQALTIEEEEEEDMESSSFYDQQTWQ